MNDVRTFWLEPVPRIRRKLRVFRKTWNMPEEASARVCHCDESHLLGEFDVLSGTDIATYTLDAPDPLSPKVCSKCGRQFDLVNDEYQHFVEHLYRRTDTGTLLPLSEAPPGATWDATWYHDIPHWCGWDGRAIVVICPDGHHWAIDGRCSNCTKPDEWTHRCWCRHGTPEKADLTVDKNGNTCNAGGGSIQIPKWHGFLTNGVLSERR